MYKYNDYTTNVACIDLIKRKDNYFFFFFYQILNFLIRSQNSISSLFNCFGFQLNSIKIIIHFFSTTHIIGLDSEFLFSKTKHSPFKWKVDSNMGSAQTISLSNPGRIRVNPD